MQEERERGGGDVEVALEAQAAAREGRVLAARGERVEGAERGEERGDQIGEERVGGGGGGGGGERGVEREQRAVQRAPAGVERGGGGRAGARKRRPRRSTEAEAEVPPVEIAAASYGIGVIAAVGFLAAAAVGVLVDLS